MKRSSYKLAVLFLAAALAGGLAATSRAENVDKQSNQPTAAVTHGLRVFSSGHSFSQFVIPILDEIAKAAGISDHQVAGKSSIGGSRVMQHWEVADDKNEAKKALRAGNVDVLTLAPIWMPEEGIEKFAKLGFEHNPKIRVTVQEYWLPNDTYEPKYPLDTKKKVDHDATNLAELQKNQDHYDHDVDEFVRAINKQLGKDVIVTIPVGQAAVALREKIAAGQAPGLKRQWDLFRDTWGHPQAPLRVLSAYCYFAVIYHRSPVGLPVPSDLATMDTPPRKAGRQPAGYELPKVSDSDKEKLNRLLQELAWDAVTHAPLTGFGADSHAQLKGK